MPKLRENQFPSYRLHKQSGQAVVTLSGRDILLGIFESPESREEYSRLVAEWVANGRQLPQARPDLTVGEFIAAFWTYARTYYAEPDGSASSETENFRMALKRLRALYGRTPVADFKPIGLKVVREAMIKPRVVKDPTTGAEHEEPGWCRTHINRQMGRLKRAFKWGVENDLVPASVFHGLQAIGGLRRGKSEARESEPVLPVPDPYVDAAIRHVSPQVRAMIELQQITGMRPGEVCMMRTADIDTTGKLWTYKPATHKTQHHGHARTIYLGRRCQAILTPFLRPTLTEYLFSPADAEAWRREQQHARRKTPLSCGNVPGSNRTRRPQCTPGARYDVDAYRRAISRACDRADLLAKAGVVIGNDERIVPRWHPHQLRHNAATRLRKEYGLEAAQVILGHKTLSVTEVYAEKNVEAAMRIMGEVG